MRVFLIDTISRFEILKKSGKEGRWGSEAHSESSRTSKMDLFAKIVNGVQPLTIFAKRSILDVQLGSEYASEINFEFLGMWLLIKKGNKPQSKCWYLFLFLFFSFYFFCLLFFLFGKVFNILLIDLSKILHVLRE